MTPVLRAFVHLHGYCGLTQLSCVITRGYKNHSSQGPGGPASCLWEATVRQVKKTQTRAAQMAGLQLEYTVCLASGVCHDVSISETFEKQRQPQANRKQNKSVRGKGVYFASWVERCSNPTREQKATYRHSGEQSRESEGI